MQENSNIRIDDFNFIANIVTTKVEFGKCNFPKIKEELHGDNSYGYIECCYKVHLHDKKHRCIVDATVRTEESWDMAGDQFNIDVMGVDISSVRRGALYERRQCCEIAK